jgi:isopentenyldiphosphate isomerase
VAPGGRAGAPGHYNRRVGPAEELLNIYDAEGRVVGARPRRAAKASGLAVGAVNILVLNERGEVLLQRRPRDKENGGHWDKSVGGHVSAGEEFDTTAVRESGEELFDDPRSTRIRLAHDLDEFDRLARSEDLARTVLIRRVGLQLNLRDVRHAPGGGCRNVLYHLAIYHGRTAVPLHEFRPQKSEIDELRYVAPAELDQFLLDGRLPPNMAFLWLTQGHLLLGGAR